MLFWLFAVVIVAAVALPLALPLLRRSHAAPAAAHDLAFHRAALDEIDRDHDRGVLSDAEAERARLEVSRRLLDADRRLARAGGDGQDTPRRLNRIAAAAVALSVGVASLGLYAVLGAPGVDDRPRASRIAEARAIRAGRPSQTEAEAAAARSTTRAEAGAGEPQIAALLDRLRARLKENPNEARGWRILANTEAARGRFRAAYEAQERLIEVLGTEAMAGDYATLADLRIRAAGGLVSAEAEAAIGQALMRDPRNGIARYYRGLLEAQTGRPDRAFAIWRPLLEQSPPDAPWMGPLRGLIREVATQAGVDYVPPSTGAPDPTASQMAAAGEMGTEERKQMIRGMVGRLAGRLETEGGTAEEWARLIRAYGVLGDTGKARQAAADARAALAGSPGAMTVIEAAARAAEIAVPGE